MTSETNTVGAGSAAEPFINKAEVARRLGKTVRTVDNYMLRGCIPFYRIGGRSVVFKWSEVVAYMGETCRVCRRSVPPGTRMSYGTSTQANHGTTARG
jgi:predicted DNA-binding transcriptional regulator AlpA